VIQELGNASLPATSVEEIGGESRDYFSKYMTLCEDSEVKRCI
jgi:hypothetical protein